MADLKKRVILLILDGLGIADANKGNAVKLAKTPNLTKYWDNNVHTQLQASGNFVGLPEGTMGNSEVGHMSIGAGKILFQEVAYIDMTIKDKSFFDNEVFKEAVKHVKKNKSRMHLMGLVSHGKVHSSVDHLFACLDFCKKEGLKEDQVLIDVFTDGRDSPPNSAGIFLTLVDDYIKKNKIGKIATIIGRYYAMDRDERWERTRKAYDLLTEGKGTKVSTWKEALDLSYGEKVTDEYLKPYLIINGQEQLNIVSENDSVVFYNYRADRAIQIAQAFANTNFKAWQRQIIKNLFFVGFSNYEKGIPLVRTAEDIEIPGGESQFVKEQFAKEIERTVEGFPEHQIFPPERVDKSLGQVIAEEGLSQLRIAESEKFPHISYFFSCRNLDLYKNEQRIEIPSPKDVATYDKKPEMSTYQITERLVKEISSKDFNFILVNFALTDMVAHTGNIQAGIKAVEVADECADKVVQAGIAKGYEILITADHGNVEEMINLKTNQVDTQHSTNLVPFFHVSPSQSSLTGKEIAPGMLIDIAPTILGLLGIKPPDEMTGRNLLQ